MTQASEDPDIAVGTEWHNFVGNDPQCAGRLGGYDGERCYAPREAPIHSEALKPDWIKCPEAIFNVPKPLDTQVGGYHYKNFKIQPLEFILANNIPFCEGNIIKYVIREKGSRLEDLKKARHYLDVLIEREENEGRDNSVRA